ncbi:MAG: hypothetical protein IJ153_06695 [Clostridia bacterium]|nr:hypothetical protein [Clostridia bacterium]
MKREARDIRERMPRPVKRIPLEENPTGKRIAGALVALAVAGLALFFALRGLTQVDAGWTWIEGDSAEGPVTEVRLWAELGAESDSPLTERRYLTKLFSQASRELYTLFTPYEIVSGVQNLWWINHHPNEEIQVDPRLYGALRESAEAGRQIFLGPVYEIWDGVFFSESDGEAQEADPLLNPETGAVLAEMMALLGREDQISLDFLAENKVRLNLAPELAALGAEMGTDRYLDFGWTQNAYIADLLAEALGQAGWTRGILSSPDGFIRCLDDRGPFTLEVLTSETGKISQAALAEYEGPAAALQLLPTPQGTRRRFYQYGDGTLRTTWISTEDGQPHQGADSWTVLSPGGTCGGALRATLELITAEKLGASQMETLAQEGISALVQQGDNMYLIGDGLRLMEGP